MEHPDIEQIQNVIASSDLMIARALLTQTINPIEFGTSLDPFALYCAKTGARIGQRDESQIFLAIKSLGKDDFQQLIFSSPGLHIAPLWINCGPRPLDQMQIFDPVGYAVYCLNLATAQFFKPPFIKRQAERESAANRLWAIARTHAILSKKTNADIGKLNTLLCSLLTYAPETTNYMYRRLGKIAQSPDRLARLFIKGELCEIIQKTIAQTLSSIGLANNHIERTKFAEIPRTPADAARGPSQIRGQIKARRNVQIAQLDHLYGDFGDLLRNAEMPANGTFSHAGLGTIKGKLTSLAIDYRDRELTTDFSGAFGETVVYNSARAKPGGPLEPTNTPIPMSAPISPIAQTQTILTFQERLARLAAKNREVQTESAPPKPKSALERMRANLQEKRT